MRKQAIPVLATALILALTVAAGAGQSAVFTQQTQRYGDERPPADHHSMPTALPHPRGLPRRATTDRKPSHRYQPKREHG